MSAVPSIQPGPLSTEGIVSWHIRTDVIFELRANILTDEHAHARDAYRVFQDAFYGMHDNAVPGTALAGHGETIWGPVDSYGSRTVVGDWWHGTTSGFNLVPPNVEARLLMAFPDKDSTTITNE